MVAKRVNKLTAVGLGALVEENALLMSEVTMGRLLREHRGRPQ